MRAHCHVCHRFLFDDRRHSNHEQLQRSDDSLRKSDIKDESSLDLAGRRRCVDGVWRNRRIRIPTATRQTTLGCDARILGYVNVISQDAPDYGRASPPGLSAVIFMGITAISGCSALFSQELRTILQPLFTKSSHNVLAITTFVTAAIGMCYTLGQQRFNKRHDPGNLRIVMIWILCSLLVLTLIGPFKTLYRYSRSALSR